MACALALALTPLAFFRPVLVLGRSMEPGLGDRAVCLALRPWCAGAPARGQRWLLDTPAGAAVKRLVGLPGDRVELRDGRLRLNGRPLEEPYPTRQGAGPEGPWEAGPGYFFLGDNRDASRDSRTWGALPAASLRGRILGAWPRDRVGRPGSASQARQGARRRA